MRHDSRPVAWIVEDNERSMKDASADARRLGLKPVEMSTQEDFIETLADVSTRGAPAIVILDLRLPWGTEGVFADNALAGGLGCLELLRQEPLTARVPVVVFSTFVHDGVIGEALLEHQPVTLVDKMDRGRLTLAIDNLLPARRLRTIERLRRMIRWGERPLLRLGAIAAAGAAIVTAFAWAISHLV